MRNRQNRDYVKLKFQLKEDTVKFTKSANNKYDLTFKYDAQGSVLISIFTHVKDSSEMIHNITQSMKIQGKGSEEHIVCREGSAIPHEVKGLKVDANDPYTYTKNIADIKDQIYPCVVRMVRNFTFFREIIN